MLSDAAEIAGDASRAGILDRVSHLANATSSVFSALITIANFKNMLSLKKSDPDALQPEHVGKSHKDLLGEFIRSFQGDDKKKAKKVIEILGNQVPEKITIEQLKNINTMDLTDEQRGLLITIAKQQNNMKK